MSISYENTFIPPMISLTSPLETNVETIFFPPVRDVSKKRPAGQLEELFKDDVKTSHAAVAGSIRTVRTAVFSHVKPNSRQIDPGQFYMDHFVSNKENRDQYYFDRNKHVTTTRKPPSRENTAHVRQHVFRISENMSGTRAQIKKSREPASVRGKNHSEKQSFASVKTTRDKKSGVTSKPEKVSSTVHELRSAKLTPKETLPTDAVIGKEVSKSTAAKPEEKKSRPNALPNVDQSQNQPLLHLAENSSREPHTWRLSPRSLLGQITEESSTNAAKRGMSGKGTQPKGLGTKTPSPVDRTKSPAKVSPNVSSARKKNDKSPRGASVEERFQEMALPKVTINEVLQSWNIGPQRTRSSSLAGKDPMEFLRRDRSLSDPKSRPTSYEELRRCRYLRTDKDDQGIHDQFCSCNSCEHGEALRNTPYLNS